MKSTLLLNADGSPMSVIPLSAISWKDAIRLYYLDKVMILDSYETIIHSPSQSLAKPSVVIAKKYQKMHDVVSFSRVAVLYRDNMTCQYCGNQFSSKHLTLDHVKPKSQNGAANFENIVAACLKCNQEKANKYIKPLKKPHVPTRYELARNRKKLPIILSDKSWQKYLLWDEDKVSYGQRQDYFRFEDIDFD